MAIALQPCANTVAYKNYQNTIENHIILKGAEPYMNNDDFMKLEQLYPDGHAPVWGVMSARVDDWKKLSVGDIVLFYKEKKFFSKGTVTYKLHNRKLAESLWAKDNNGNTWEYIYFLDEFVSLNIHIKAFNEMVGYKENNFIQAFQICSDEISNRLSEGFSIKSELYYPDVSDRDFQSALQTEEKLLKQIEELKSEDSLDVDVAGSSRKEQAYLRKKLFNNKKEEICGICHRKIPVPLLTAAHIKKRSRCTLAEKLDAENIVMPMCKLYGCDDLYEKGFIYIEDGVIKTDDKNFTSEALLNTLKALDGRICNHYSDKTKGYFDYHKACIKF